MRLVMMKPPKMSGGVSKKTQMVVLMPKLTEIGEKDTECAQPLRESLGNPTSAHCEETSNTDQTRQGVGDRHEGRVEGRGDAPNSTESDESGETKGVDHAHERGGCDGTQTEDGSHANGSGSDRADALLPGSEGLDLLDNSL